MWNSGRLQPAVGPPEGGPYVPINEHARGGDAFEPWQLFTLAGLIGATVVVFVSRGQTPAGIIFLSLTIFAAAIVGVAMWRTLAPFTGSDDRTGPTVVGGRTRAALEREKALVLRSIKALEFDQAMGKVSDKDFAEMSARLRARAAGLMRQLDAGTGYRDQIEKEIARRVGAGSKKQDPASVKAQDPASADDPAYAASQVRTCSACSRNNDLDARFCKHCGASLG
jgi:hypothetical protein